MHVVSEDLGLAHLYMVYPGNLRYPLGDGITALPFREMGNVGLREAAH